ncbi:MAG: hypothetical protein ACODAA_04525 [Gemmatimonadota bacterium]
MRSERMIDRGRTIRRFLAIYIVPGAVLQSVMIAGGYGTGRELVEYFTRHGPTGGLLAMAVTVVCWALVLAVTYEFARTFAVYDYRGFFRKLLGRGWIVFEALFLLMFLLVLSVVGSAAGEVLQQSFGLPYGAGLLLMLALVGGLVFFGRDVVTRVLTAWSFVLYGIFFVYFGVALSRFGGEIAAALTVGGASDGWALDGFRYAMYNLAVVPAVLFSARRIRTRRQAVVAGCAAALICIIPAVLFHISFLGAYPGVEEQEIPVYWMIGRLGAPILLVVYVVGLFGTFIETGAGYIQGINERIDSYLLETEGTTLSKPVRALIAVSGLLISAGLGSFGIIALIAQGYGTISWGFFAVYVVPVMTYGVLQLVRHSRRQARSATVGVGEPDMLRTD